MFIWRWCWCLPVFVAADELCEAALGCVRHCDSAADNLWHVELGFAGSCCFLHRQRGEFGFALGDGVFKLGGAFGPLFWWEGF